MLTAPQNMEYCAFRVGEHCFAIDSACVAEVLHTAARTRVPLAPESIAGLLHLRGRIVPVIDMCRRLGGVGAGGQGTHLVIRIGEDWYGLLVDEVLDVESIPVDRIEHPTAPGGGSSTDAVTGVVMAEDRLLHILDPEQLVKPLFKHRTSSLLRHGVTHGG